MKFLKGRRLSKLVFLTSLHLFFNMISIYYGFSIFTRQSKDNTLCLLIHFLYRDAPILFCLGAGPARLRDLVSVYAEQPGDTGGEVFQIPIYHLLDNCLCIQ
jgi:hypothetical protein